MRSSWGRPRAADDQRLSAATRRPWPNCSWIAALSSGRQCDQPLDQSCHGDGPRRLHVDESIRTLEQRDVLAFEIESGRARTQDQDALTISNRSNDRREEDRFG